MSDQELRNSIDLALLVRATVGGKRDAAKKLLCKIADYADKGTLTPIQQKFAATVFRSLAEDGEALKYLNPDARKRRQRTEQRAREIYQAVEREREKGTPLSEDGAFLDVAETMKMSVRSVSRAYYEYKDIVADAAEFHWLKRKDTLDAIVRSAVFQQGGIFIHYAERWPEIPNAKAIQDCTLALVEKIELAYQPLGVEPSDLTYDEKSRLANFLLTEFKSGNLKKFNWPELAESQ